MRTNYNRFKVETQATKVAKRLDPLSPSQRSERMSRVRSRDSKLEMTVRHMVHSMGFRYRLHDKRLPGHPDLVFPSRRAVLFVNSCFWHLHDSCTRYRLPKSRTDFWLPKLERNRTRDADNLRKLSDLGWRTITVWECELCHDPRLGTRIREFLGP